MSATERLPWLERCEELKKYKEKYGDCNVPKKHGPLGNWVHKQRMNYWLLKEGKPSPMSDDRIQKLESIGFQWFIGRGKMKNEKAVLWDAQFQELKKYKEKHGDCNVFHRHGTLGRWVGTQRTNYRLLKTGKCSYMSDDRIHKLESIGFQWSLGHSKLENKRLGQLWDAQFQELKKYKEKHEDCSVIHRHGPLGRWVGTQRNNYRLLKAGKRASMSDDRIHKLESIGFQWSCSRQRDSSAFMQVTTNNTPSDAKSGKYKRWSENAPCLTYLFCLFSLYT